MPHGRPISGKKASSVLRQLLLFSPAWPRSGREGDLHVFNNTPESVWVAQGAECAVCQEDEGRRHPFSSRRQHGCYPLEGQVTSGYSFHKCSARDGGSRKEGTRGQEEGGSTQTSSGVHHQHGGVSTWLTSTTLTTLLDGHLYGGGDTFVGGCCRRPWSTLSSSGAKATSLL